MSATRRKARPALNPATLTRRQLARLFEAVGRFSRGDAPCADLNASRGRSGNGTTWLMFIWDSDGPEVKGKAATPAPCPECGGERIWDKDPWGLEVAVCVNCPAPIALAGKDGAS